MESNPYDSPRLAGKPPKTETGPWKRVLLGVLAAGAVMVMLVALLLPNVRNAGGAARRAQCTNNLKQIALALRSYEAERGALPPAYTVDANGKPLHSWRTLILPFMEQQRLFDAIDLAKPWDDPANKAARETSPSVYHCPSAACPATHTTYLAIVGPGCCLQPGQPRKLSEITDDPNSTLMVMETSAERAVHWMSPVDASQQDVLGFKTAGALPHPGGASAAFVSGRIHVMQEDTDPAMLRALLSIAGDDDAVAREADEGRK